MIRSVVKEILPYVQTLNFADLVAGIVTPATKKIINSEGNATIKIFPIYENTPSQCSSGDYVTLIPDEKYKSIIYFEEVNSIIISQSNYEIKFRADVRLVGWFNLKKISTTVTSDKLSALILRNVPQSIADFDNIYNVNILFNGFENKNPLVFSAYTYDESETQYLLFPYDYCSMRFNIEYSLGRSCEDDVSLTNNCGKK